jgi:hypothetical protein
MTNEQWQLLTKVMDLIQRDALIVRLGEERIEVLAPDRDVIVNLGGGPNIALEGYSAVFDGYSVLVKAQDLTRAKQILADFHQTPRSDTPSTTDFMSKFHLSSALSFILPVILHISALYHLIKAIQNGQFKWGIKTVFSLLILLATGGALIVFLL